MIKAIIVTTVLILSSGICYLFDSNNYEDPCDIQMIDTTDDQEQVTYESSIHVSQADLKLDHEVIQYKIMFHDNATVTIDGLFKYILPDLDPIAYILCLTDGEKTVEDISMVHSKEPTGMIVDISTRRRYLKIGGKLLYKVINVGVDSEIKKKTCSVQDGDAWYLTFGVYRTVGEEIVIDLRSDRPCMEPFLVERHNKIEYLSAWRNDFDDGFYFGFRFLAPLPFGLSLARDLRQTITMSRGAILFFTSAFHLKAQLKVEKPDGSVYFNDNPRMITFNYAGNVTGDWEFSASGIGFPWKHMVSLIYADVDPHILPENWIP